MEEIHECVALMDNAAYSQCLSGGSLPRKVLVASIGNSPIALAPMPDRRYLSFERLIEIHSQSGRGHFTLTNCPGNSGVDSYGPIQARIPDGHILPSHALVAKGVVLGVNDRCQP
jgi:hypothetical protein